MHRKMTALFFVVTVFLISFLFFIFFGDPVSALFLFPLQSSLLTLSQCPHSVSWAWCLADFVGNLTTADQTQDDTGTDDEGKDETVGRVPGRRPAQSCCSGIGEVEEREGEELADKTNFDWQKQSWPCNSCGDDTDSVSVVTFVTTKTSPFKTPMDGTKE